MTKALHTPGDWSAKYFEALENDGAGTLLPAGKMKRSIFAVRKDDQGRRCAQIVAEVFERGGYPVAGGLGNTCQLVRGKRPLPTECQ
jgi:hypothetical protein